MPDPRLLAAAAALALCAAPALAQEPPRPPDPVYDCPWVFRGEVMFRGVLAERAPVRRGAPAGTARKPSCHPYPQADIQVRVFRLRGASPRLALVGADRERSIYVRVGTLPQLPGHPAHRPIYGAAGQPDLRTGRRCAKPRRVTGRLANTPPAGGLLELGATEIAVDARTVVRGARRIAGQPVLRRGERVSATVRAKCLGTSWPVAVRLAVSR